MGVCHRDMSLENILLDQDSTSIIIDLGMCLRVPFAPNDDDGQVTDVTSGNLRLLINPMIPCGKRYYVSPEVIQSEGPFDGFAIDLWASGVILFIMLVGLPPWEGALHSDQRYRTIINGGLARMLQSWGRQVSGPAADLLQNMLNRNPRERLSLGEVMDHPWVLDEDGTGAFPPQFEDEPWRG
jgi:serine/threonine protein kinase